MAHRPTPTAFLGAHRAKSPAGFSAAIFGAHHATPYKGIDSRVHEGTADALRRALAADADFLESWDFDLDNTLLSHGLKIADLGNLSTSPKTPVRNREVIEGTTRRILDAGAIPIMLGGDDSTPIPFLAGFAGGPAITILQIDAHIDWRDERFGETLGFSSTMRRASEMTHVWRIVQAGAHGIGSARQGEVDAAIAWGARLVSARTIHTRGVDAVLEHVPEDSDCVLCVDCDAIDAAQMPAVVYPKPGGLSYTQIAGLIEGVAAKARIAGAALVEFVPKKDKTGAGAFLAARLICNVIGRLAPPL